MFVICSITQKFSRETTNEKSKLTKESFLHILQTNLYSLKVRTVERQELVFRKQFMQVGLVFIAHITAYLTFVIYFVLTVLRTEAFLIVTEKLTLCSQKSGCSTETQFPISHRQLENVFF